MNEYDNLVDDVDANRNLDAHYRTLMIVNNAILRKNRRHKHSVFVLSLVHFQSLYVSVSLSIDIFVYGFICVRAYSRLRQTPLHEHRREHNNHLCTLIWFLIRARQPTPNSSYILQPRSKLYIRIQTTSEYVVSFNLLYICACVCSARRPWPNDVFSCPRHSSHRIWIQVHCQGRHLVRTRRLRIAERPNE